MYNISLLPTNVYFVSLSREALSDQVDPEDIMYSVIFFYIWIVCVPFLGNLKGNTSRLYVEQMHDKQKNPLWQASHFQLGPAVQTGKLNSITEKRMSHTFRSISKY